MRGKAWLELLDTPFTDEESSEPELPTTYRINKKVYMAVSNAIKEGHDLDHHKATRGLSQISPSKALMVLSNRQTATHNNEQQHLDIGIRKSSQHKGAPPQLRNTGTQYMRFGHHG